MVAIELDSVHQERLDKLAEAQGQDKATLARRIIEDYLDFEAMGGDSEEAWAQASIALTPEIMGPEDWNEPDHGS
jgi:predicted transcriptional regulator